MDIELHRAVDPGWLEQFRTPYCEAMGTDNFGEFVSWTSRVENFSLFIARLSGQVAGIKAGRASSASQYHSWVGFVLSAFRRRGVATALMNAQHQWCREQGYAEIRTRTRNRFAAMLQLNLRAGFSVTGAFSQGGAPKIVLTRPLLSSLEEPPEYDSFPVEGLTTCWGNDRARLAGHIAAGRSIVGSLLTAKGTVVLLGGTPTPA